MVRTIPPNTKMGYFVVEICRHFHWTRITLVVSASQEAIITAAAIEVRLRPRPRPNLRFRISFHFPDTFLSFYDTTIGLSLLYKRNADWPTTT